MPLRRLPIESARPIEVFARVRLGLSLLAVVVVLVLGFPYGGRLVAVAGGVAVPWSLFCLALARRRPEMALSPLVAVGDMLMLVAIEAVAPESYGAMRFIALTLLAVHAHFLGERIGAAVAAFAVVALVVPTAIADEGAVRGELLAFYESVFAAAALAVVILVGRFRTTESASRLRARQVTRQSMEAEREIRRRLSESLHDGPVQELIGLDMTLTAARHEADRSGATEVARLVDEARGIAARNIEALRDEILDLGPYAYEDFSYEAAVERCLPAWKRRYGLRAELRLDRVELDSNLEGELFRITQEAVLNAAKHGRAATVTISLIAHDGRIELRVRDDGGGFAVDPLASTEPGHIGLASIRERTELLDGTLSIESSEEGSELTVSVPQPRPRSRGSR